MSQYQVCLYEGQKQLLLKYIRERRSNDIISLLATAVIFIYEIMLITSDTIMENSLEMKFAIVYHSVIIAVSGFAFIVVFIGGFGKTFGFRCDRKCIENDWYTLTYGNFVCRDENPRNKPPYYISDKSYNQYICPRFVDWKYSTEDTMFIYIRLENGRGYAIVDK